MPVPAGTKGRDCDVAITRDRLRVGLKGQPPVLGEWVGGAGACAAVGGQLHMGRLEHVCLSTPVAGEPPACTASVYCIPPCLAAFAAHSCGGAEGPLFAAVKPDDCLWNLVDGRQLELTLAKRDGMQWWRCVVEGQPEIDVQGVEPEASKLTDLGEAGGCGWCGWVLGADLLA